MKMKMLRMFEVMPLWRTIASYSSLECTICHHKGMKAIELAAA